MIKIELLVQIMLPVLLSFLSYLYGRKKSDAEIKKLEIESKNLEIESRKLEIEADTKESESEKNEIDVMDRIVKFYEDKVTEMLDEIESLKKQIKELKEIIEDLVSNQCKDKDCPTKKEYDKIMVQREKRKRTKSLKNANVNE